MTSDAAAVCGVVDLRLFAADVAPAGKAGWLEKRKHLASAKAIRNTANVGWFSGPIEVSDFAPDTADDSFTQDADEFVIVVEGELVVTTEADRLVLTKTLGRHSAKRCLLLDGRCKHDRRIDAMRGRKGTGHESYCGDQRERRTRAFRGAARRLAHWTDAVLPEPYRLSVH
jgi:hypothetical protein